MRNTESPPNLGGRNHLWERLECFGQNVAKGPQRKFQMMQRCVCRSRRLKVALCAADGIFASCDVAEHFGLAMRADFGIYSPQEPAGIFGIVFEIDTFESRIEPRLRMGFLVGGGEEVWRVRMKRRALKDSALIFCRSPRFVGTGASAATILSRARLAALWGMWTGDMHRFSSSCGHEQGVELYRKGVQTIFEMWLQMRSFWRDGRPRRAGMGIFGISAAPLPAAGIRGPA